MEAAALEQRPAYGEISLLGEHFYCDHDGALYWPGENLLVISDLHLEKGAAMAARGALLPPYDTLATLQLLAGCIERWQPQTVISLGDSFHRKNSAEKLPGPFRDQLNNMMQPLKWIWIGGNHDPRAPAGLGGEFIEELRVGPIHFRHEQAVDNFTGEISGHLHPKAAIHRRGKRMSRRCFVSDGQRLIMPAFGAFTGGLDISNAAFAGILDEQQLQIWMLGRSQVYEISRRHLSPRS